MIEQRKYPWVAKQDWSNILFLNWPVPLEVIRPLVPKSFIIDTYKGTAWVSIVIFEAKNSHPRFMPQLFSFPSVTQINVRTYVKYPHSQERGVYFFYLNVKSLLAVIGAQTIFQLPFRYLQTNMFHEQDAIYVTAAKKRKTVLSIKYHPQKKSVQDCLAKFIVERYCIWHVKGKKIIKIPILHTIWDIQKVNVEIKQNKLFPNISISEPTAFFHPYKQTKLYPYEGYGYKT